MYTSALDGQILAKITSYIRGNLLGGLEDEVKLTDTTPLLKLGILNSRNTGKLLAFINEEFGIEVPPARITGKYFANLGSISDLVAELAAADRAM